MGKRTRVKPVSDKQAIKNEVRRDLLEQWMEESEDFILGYAPCEIRWDRRCGGRAVEGHEPLMRSSGGDINDRRNVRLTCRHCHRSLHAHPTLAEERGFLVRDPQEIRSKHL